MGGSATSPRPPARSHAYIGEEMSPREREGSFFEGGGVGVGGGAEVGEEVEDFFLFEVVDQAFGHHGGFGGGAFGDVFLQDRDRFGGEGVGAEGELLGV